jgi:hypothetical protein
MQTFKIVTETKFWETQTAYAGPVNANEMKRIPGFRHWYSWTRQKTGTILSIVLQEERMSGRTVLCTMNSDQDLDFYDASIIADANYGVTAVAKALLEENHALMRGPSEIKMDVFEHYRYILGIKPGGPDGVQASWPLSHSS